MSSQARSAREEERRLSIRTLAIASAASAVSAIVTSRLWSAGTPIAAAMTPVIVTIVSEMLHRPTAKIVERFTTETDALPEAAGAGRPPPPRESDEAEPAREQPARERPDHERREAEPEPIDPGGRETGPAAATGGARAPGVRVYRSPRRTLPWKLIAATGALAFVIGVAVLSLPQLIAGESLVKGNPPLYGSASKGDKDKASESRPDPSQPAEEPDATTPERTTPEPTETEAPPTTTAPAPEEPPGDQTAPQKPAPQQTLPDEPPQP